MNYDMKLSQLSYIYYVTGYMTDHIIIRFYDITIAFSFEYEFQQEYSI